MPVTIPDTVARDVRRAVERHVQEMPGERLQALVLGDTEDKELEALVILRQALRSAAERSKPLPTDDGRSIAIGRHAFDFLVERGVAASALKSATPRRTLVGLRFDSVEDIESCVEALRHGAAESANSLEIQRFEHAAERLALLAEIAVPAAA